MMYESKIEVTQKCIGKIYVTQYPFIMWPSDLYESKI